MGNIRMCEYLKLVNFVCEITHLNPFQENVYQRCGNVMATKTAWTEVTRKIVRVRIVCISST